MTTCTDLVWIDLCETKIIHHPSQILQTRSPCYTSFVHKPDFKKLKKKIPQSQAFKIGMWWRIFYGFLRLILGAVAIKLINVPFQDILYTVMSHELTEDSTDVLFQVLNSFLINHPLAITTFVPIYLIFWGLVDIILSINLLKHNLWAFPVSLYLIGFFVLYELIRLYQTHSLLLLCVIIIDIIVFILIRNEYVYTLGQMHLEHGEKE